MDLHSLWVELNRPGAERFAAALKKRGVKARPADIRELFTRHIGVKQIFAPPPRLKGHIYSPGKDVRWMADIIVNTHMPSTVGDTTYRAILVAQDVFTRYAFAEPMEGTGNAAAAMASIFRHCSRAGHSIPLELVTDGDGAFKSPAFRASHAGAQVVHVFKESLNDIGTVDRLISTLRRALAEESAESGEPDWASRLRKVVSGYNHAPQAHLPRGEDPADVDKDPAALFDLTYAAAGEMQHNSDEIERRAEKLRATGAFRVLFVKRKEGFRREVFRREVFLVFFRAVLEQF